MWGSGNVELEGRTLQLSQKPAFSFNYEEIEFRPDAGVAFYIRDEKRLLLTLAQQRQVEQFVRRAFELGHG
jgi:hypothetical protein